MKPFNLKDWRDGALVITRSGKIPEQLTYFEGAVNSKRRLFGVVDGEAHRWDDEGNYCNHLISDDLDLFHPEEAEMWVNVIRLNSGKPFVQHETFSSRAEALKNRMAGENYLGTYKIVKP